MKNYEKAAQYVADVRSGKEPACKWVRLAVERHVRDLERSTSVAYRYRYDAEKAERVCKVIQNLPHTKGKWARDRETIELQPWQAFILCGVFGWVDKATGFRRFREVLIMVPRKNGKSVLTSGVGIYMLGFDNEEGAEIYCNATTEKQAWEVFKPAKLMVENTPELKQAKGIVCNASNLNIPATASKFEPVIGKPGDGASPSMGICDEYHEHQTPDAHDTLLTGMGAREQPILWIISTAGDNTSGPCYARQLEVQDILAGAVEDERTFGIIYTIDEGDLWSDPAVLRKANPNLGVSVDEEFLLDMQQKAIRNPRDQGRFKTKHLNLWVNSRSAYFNMASWADCPSAPPIEEMAGRECHIALDLASKTDIAALEMIFPLGEGHYARYGKSYLPEDTVNDPANGHYFQWQEKGYIESTPGNILDFETIEDDVKAACETFQVLSVAYDPYQGNYLATRLMAQNVPMVEYRMTVASMSDPMKSLDAAIQAGKLHHNCGPDHPMTWQMGNVTAQADKKDNVYPTKERAEKKIDNPVACIMALGRALEQPSGEDSAYENRGLMVL
jgi:phage terminase large subunit-like protein